MSGFDTRTSSSINASPTQPSRMGTTLIQCLECETSIQVDHENDANVIACPKCGQCVSAPMPFSITEWSLVRPSWPLSYSRSQAGPSLVMGLIVMSLGLIPYFPVYVQLGVAFLGGAILSEGLTRLFEDRREARSVRDANVFPSLSVSNQFGNSAMLGDLKAVFRTKNDPLDTLTLCLFGAMMTCGAAWAFDWLMGGAAPVKLVLIVLVLPLMIGYAVYRGFQLLADKRAVYIYDRGVRWTQRKDESLMLWEQVTGIKAIHVGDMIDEDAIEVTGPMRKLRVTRGHYRLFEECWCRIQQEAAEYIESGRIDIRVVNQAAESP